MRWKRERNIYEEKNTHNGFIHKRMDIHCHMSNACQPHPDAFIQAHDVWTDARIYYAEAGKTPLVSILMP
jgi:hypothetical protein